ncbi:MAG: ribosome biogenesis GTP-binding protein YihA/YsxC [Spirochaetia bacterium]|nr:ribosome biogenesis GTP-binding protein YihA/YsxC [Spirochaetia bacterium]
MLKKQIVYERDKLSEADFVGSFTDVMQMPTDLREICLMGKSNSGKSTLISSLIRNSSNVKISKSPGSTKTVNFFKLGNLHLVDLPGYGYAKTSHSGRNLLSEIIDHYLTLRKNIAAAFLLLDCNRDLGEAEEYLVELMRQRNIPLILILTKIDRLNQKEMSFLNKKIKDYFETYFFQVFAVSGKKRENLLPLLNYIRSLGG